MKGARFSAINDRNALRGSMERLASQLELSRMLEGAVQELLLGIVALLHSETIIVFRVVRGLTQGHSS